MRIDDDVAGVRRVPTPRAAAAGRSPAAAATAEGGDRITLSGAARDLAWVREAVGPLDEMRVERVEGLRPIVVAGDYRVDPPLVARRFLIEELGGLVA